VNLNSSPACSKKHRTKAQITATTKQKKNSRQKQKSIVQKLKSQPQRHGQRFTFFFTLVAMTAK